MCVNIIYVCICLYCVICLILYYRSLLICTNKEFMNILLFKVKYYGVTDTALDLMSSYLNNRKQYVVFNNNLNTLKYILVYHRDPS